jgi:hypothetical protein
LSPNDYVRIASKVIDYLERLGYQSDKDPIRHVFIMLTIGCYKTKAVKYDLGNEALGELLISELNQSLQAHFARKTTTEIMRSILISILKYGRERVVMMISYHVKINNKS